MSVETARKQRLPDWANDEEHDEPLASQDHSMTIDNLHYPLYSRFSGPHCYVASELRVHRDPAGAPRALRDYNEPDILVAFDVPAHVRKRYIIAEEGKGRGALWALVIDVLSDSSKDNGDLEDKRDWYLKEGVREYVVVDPLGHFAPEPRLQSWVFSARTGSDAAEHVLAGADGVLRSRVLPVGWLVQGDWVRLLDLESGQVLPLLWEIDAQLREEIRARQLLQAELRQAEERAWAEAEARRQAEEQARAEAAQRLTLEAEVERLRKLLEGRD